MVVTVTKLEKTEKGSWYVCFDDKPTRYYVSQKIAPPTLGAVIDAVTVSKRFEGAKYDTWFLNSFKAAEVKTAAQVKQEIAEKQLPILAPINGWKIDAGDCSRFVSNVVASAIAASRITRPTDIHPWIAAAYTAVQGLREGKPVDFDDAMPPFVEPDENEDPEFEDDSSVPF